MKLHTYLYQPSQKFYLNGTFFTIKMGGKPTDRKLVSMEIGSGVVCVTYQDFYVRYVQKIRAWHQQYNKPIEDIPPQSIMATFSLNLLTRIRKNNDTSGTTKPQSFQHFSKSAQTKGQRHTMAMINTVLPVGI